MLRKEPRGRNLQVRVSQEEYAALREKFRATAHRKFADFIRDVIYRQPIIVRYRNQSLDEFLPVALGLKNELSALCKNINQALSNLNNASAPTEIKDIADYFAAEEFSLRQKTEEIKNLLIRLYEQW